MRFLGFGQKSNLFICTFGSCMCTLVLQVSKNPVLMVQKPQDQSEYQIL